ncbi:MAG: phenylacetate-CoA oxygenase/reductase subunit PaaK [Arthrobacter sp.]|jgi:ring-1,2-phenylacetyl-CoA epoxidase subunit PaaE|nr:phenylacetate-CoA oxygenase/reductase subunit PaaK [Arthrobacter sp.]
MSTDAATPARRRARFHTLPVSEVRRLTANAVEVTFAIPDEIADEFDYAAGQYVALRAQVPSYDGTPVELRRSYSICAAPVRGEIRVGIKKDAGGLFSTWANEELKVGDTIDVMNPQGTFVSKAELMRPGSGQHLVAIAAGSGITPVMAITRQVLENDPLATVDLVYANRSSSDVMFVEELADLKDSYPSRLAIHHVLTREQRISPLLTGRIDEEKMDALLDHVLRTEATDEWFLCGPMDMVQLVRDQLAEKGVAAERVRFELFTTGEVGDPSGQHGKPVVVTDDQETVEIEFQLDGLRGSVKSPVEAKETVLNAALRARPDVPFACAGGVCGTCRAKVIEGTVRMEENYALEPEEIEQGYVLTCQSHPTSERVVVDYDA